MIVELNNVSAHRGLKAVLGGINLNICAGDRIFISGENGAGKSTLLMLLAGRLHPYGSAGTRRYAWDAETGESFRRARRNIAFISRDEQLRLQSIHAASTVLEFLSGHGDGADFLYREVTAEERTAGRVILEQWNSTALSERQLKTLSFGEMRLAMVMRASLHARKLYVLDELFSGLSPQIINRVTGFLQGLPADAALIMTGHDSDRMAGMDFSREFLIADGVLNELNAAGKTARMQAAAKLSDSLHGHPGEMLIECYRADFYHDFTQIFRDLSFVLRQGDRILLTGENGSGKSTLLRIMHGDFYPAYDPAAERGESGVLRFLNILAHDHKRNLWESVQCIAASQFAYFPVAMTVQNVLASRLSGSLYEYADELPVEAMAIVSQFSLEVFLTRPFATLSEGERTRVLFARAFLRPAPVLLIDEGFIALSQKHFAAALVHLNALPAETAIVIAANERDHAIAAGLRIMPQRWHLQAGTLQVLPRH